jgi:hypothetical protein
VFGSDVESDRATSRDAGAMSTAPAVPVTRGEERRPIIAPLSGETFKIQFTAPRALRDKLRQAQDLLRHRVPDGELAAVFEKALDALIVNLNKERFAVGRKPRNTAAPAPSTGGSRDIPDGIKRAVYERAQGRCEFVAEDGRRCMETGGLEYDHVDGFARTHVHTIDGIRIVCRCHNLHAAEQMYGRVFMDRMRRDRTEAAASARLVAVGTASPPVARPGASPQQSLFQVPTLGRDRPRPAPTT